MTGTPLLSCDHITVRHGAVVALDSVTMQVDPGEVVTLVGPNGSGKSTLLRALLGIVKPSEGKVYQRPGLKIGYVPQKISIDPTLPITVERFLSLPYAVESDLLQHALQLTGVEHVAKRQLLHLSGGQFQRVLLARAVIGAPDLLMLDEPTQGLDQRGIAGFYRMIEGLQKELGASVLMVGHDLHVVMSAADRVICLNHHICCQGGPKVVQSAPEYRALFGLGTGGALALYPHMHDHNHDVTQESGTDAG